MKMLLNFQSNFTSQRFLIMNFTSKYLKNKDCLGYSGVTGGGGAETSDQEISADLLGKERQGKKGKMGKEEGKLKKGRWKIENVRR